MSNQLFRIWYGNYGNKDKLVRAKDFNEVHKKYGKLNLHQIEVERKDYKTALNIPKKCIEKRKDREIDIVNSPFSKSLGWVNKKGKITSSGRKVIEGVCN